MSTFCAVLVVAMQALGMGVAHAETLVHYSGYVHGPNGETPMSLRVEIEARTTYPYRYLEAFSSNGRFDILVPPGSHGVRLDVGYYDSNSSQNGSTFVIRYATSQIINDHYQDIEIPLTNLNLQVNNVVGGMVEGATMEIRGTVTTRLDSIGIGGASIDDLHTHCKTDLLGQCSVYRPLGAHTLIQLKPAQTGSLDPYSADLGYVYDPIVNHVAVMQFPAPPLPRNFLSSVDANGNVQVWWDVVPSASGIYVSRKLPGDVLRPLATLPGDVTSHVDGPFAAQGEYLYCLQVFNQYGYTGDSMVCTSAYFDGVAPSQTAYGWTNNPKLTTQSTRLIVGYKDNETHVGRVEFYVDSDPGYGNAQQISSTDEDGNYYMDLDGQLPGVYKVGVRAQDAAGNWTVDTVDYLVVYDSSGLGVTGKNKKDLVPSLANGDILPNLTSASQTDAADYGLTVDFKNGSMDPHNDFRFTYNTGSNCNKHNSGCHAFEVNATSIDWLVVSDTNSSRARFQGVATVSIDGTVTTNPILVETVDGDRLTPDQNDQFMLEVFAPGANPAYDAPLYRVASTALANSSVTIR